MASLDDVLSSYPVRDQLNLQTKLSLLEERTSGQRAHDSLRLEVRLSTDGWRTILDAALLAEDTAVGVMKAVRDSSRAHLLDGQTIKRSAAQEYGRAVTKYRFESTLRKANATLAAVGKRQVEREVRNLLNRDWNISRRRWKDRALGNFLMWCTFSPAGGPAFKGFKKKKDSIRRVLGLDPNDEGKPLLLLFYELPATILPQYPTIADAYSGDEWPFFFRPSKLTDSWGSTLAWPDFADVTKPRPEAVHAVILGSCLTRKPEVLP